MIYRYKKIKDINLFNKVIFLFSRERALTARAYMMSTSNSFKRIKHLPHSISNVVFAATSVSQYKNLKTLVVRWCTKGLHFYVRIFSDFIQTGEPFVNVFFLFRRIQDIKVQVNTTSLLIQGLQLWLNESLSCCTRTRRMNKNRELAAH